MLTCLDAPTVGCGHIIEAYGKQPAKLTVHRRFESRAPFDFNVNFDEGKAVRYPARQAGVAKSAGTLDTPVEQDYSSRFCDGSSGAAAPDFYASPADST